MYVATTTISKLLDYCFHTPADPGRSVECVAQRVELIRKNEALLASEL
jgi:4-O-beta-D-mannosyl-D-glucose phosphorylase